MLYNFKDMHVVTALLLIVLMTFIVFSTDNPLILLSIFIFCQAIFMMTGSREKIKKGLVYFIPFAAVSIIINFLFVDEGSTILFIAFGKNFTLEALIYALIFSSKLLLIIYIFSMIELLLNNDGAVSYFSSIMPKSTLLLTISFKLFPNLKRRINTLREVYSLRGVDFESKSIKEKAKSYTPILANLLGTSMEEAFDIGESAYVRGFLSGKRSVYQRQKASKKDIILSLHMFIILILFIFLKFKKLDTFDIYNNFRWQVLLNYYVLLMSIAILTLILSFYLNWRNKES
ncbi:MAG: energy-coupling factor transporter transmembrane protein EcfT [Clostridiales bacterium]|uniref:energy-coupling factor transporter transmembrane component T n=1 Tax=Clostridium sp. N3C TaxID=1776758 RepID=UPI00092DED58|nr:energy-coupling factor transporter transmembrane component T [Clostridium sp. N3C]NLZ49421.1 energy-coupling factor transporter transmembrane protein EcfT [Clostridiales bacterium]SCN25203.1 Energy-coupling factor transporter transmembrane protein EcfT [Clostridium sp. N3C]